MAYNYKIEVHLNNFLVFFMVDDYKICFNYSSHAGQRIFALLVLVMANSSNFINRNIAGIDYDEGVLVNLNRYLKLLKEIEQILSDNEVETENKFIDRLVKRWNRAFKVGLTSTYVDTEKSKKPGNCVEVWNSLNIVTTRKSFYAGLDYSKINLDGHISFQFYNDKLKKENVWEFFYGILKSRTPESKQNIYRISAMKSRNNFIVDYDGYINKIRKLLIDNNCLSVTQTKVIAGHGGIGKTTLAVEYAHRFSDKYPGGVFFLEMENGWKYALKCFSDLCRANKIKVPTFENIINENSASETLKKYFSDFSQKLIILDNVESQSIVNDWCPVNSHVLITSRLCDINHNQLTLELPSIEDALTIVLMHAKRTNKDFSKYELNHLKRSISQVDRLPIALEIIGKLLSKIPLIELVNHIDKYIISYQGPLIAKQEIDIAICLIIGKDKLDQIQWEVLMVSAYLSSENITIKTICSILLKSYKTIEKAFMQLSELSVIKPSRNKNCYEIHRLTQLAARSFDDKRYFGVKVADYLEEIASNQIGFDSISRNDYIIKHMLAMEKLNKVEIPCHTFPSTRLMSLISLYIDEFYSKLTAKRILNTCLKRLKNTSINSNLHATTIMTILAVINSDCDNELVEDRPEKVIAYLDNALICCKNIVGENHILYVFCLLISIMCIVDIDIHVSIHGRLSRAIKILKNINRYEIDWIMLYIQAASLLIEWGYSKESEAILLKIKSTLQCEEKIITDYSIEYLMGNVYLEQKKIGIAKQSFNNSLKLLKRNKINSKYHILPLMGLAKLMKRNHQYKKAISITKKALDISRIYIKINTLLYLETAMFLGEIYIEVHQYEKAEEVILQTVNDIEIKKGLKNIDLLIIYSQLMKIYLFQKRYEYFEKLVLKVFKILDITSYDDSNDTSISSKTQLLNIFTKNILVFRCVTTDNKKELDEYITLIKVFISGYDIFSEKYDIVYLNFLTVLLFYKIETNKLQEALKYSNKLIMYLDKHIRYLTKHHLDLLSKLIDLCKLNNEMFHAIILEDMVNKIRKGNCFNL